MYFGYEFKSQAYPNYVGKHNDIVTRVFDVTSRNDTPMAIFTNPKGYIPINVTSFLNHSEINFSAKYPVNSTIRGKMNSDNSKAQQPRYRHTGLVITATLEFSDEMDGKNIMCNMYLDYIIRWNDGWSTVQSKILPPRVALGHGTYNRETYGIDICNIKRNTKHGHIFRSCQIEKICKTLHQSKSKTNNKNFKKRRQNCVVIGVESEIKCLKHHTALN